MKIPAIVKKAINTMNSNSPAILTGMAVCGVGLTIFSTVKATTKASEILEEAKEKSNVEKFSTAETVKLCWKPFVPVVLSAGATIGCIVCAHSISAKRAAALITAYKLSEAALSEYKETVDEVVDTDVKKAIQSRISDKKMSQVPFNSREVRMTDYGEVLFFDSISSRYFRSSVAEVKRAENDLNRQCNFDMYACMNDWYDYLYLDHIGIGDYLGWNVDDGFFEVEFESKIAENGEPCIVINYNKPPKYNYKLF